jgi:hypothetical protein
MTKPAVSEVADDVYVVACHPARSSTLLRGQRRSLGGGAGRYRRVLLRLSVRTGHDQDAGGTRDGMGLWSLDRPVAVWQ